MRKNGTVTIGCLLPLAAVFFAACGEPPAEVPADPIDCIHAMREAVADQDWQSVYNLTPPSERKLFERSWDARRSGDSEELATLARQLGIEPSELAAMTYREVFPLVMGRVHDCDEFQLCANADDSCIEAQVEGIRCRIRCRKTGQRKQLTLLREDCRWFVSGVHSVVQREQLAKR